VSQVQNDLRGVDAPQQYESKGFHLSKTLTDFPIRISLSTWRSDVGDGATRMTQRTLFPSLREAYTGGHFRAE